MVLVLFITQLGPKAVKMLLSQCQKSPGHCEMHSGLLATFQSSEKGGNREMVETKDVVVDLLSRSIPLDRVLQPQEVVSPLDMSVNISALKQRFCLLIEGIFVFSKFEARA